MKVKIFLILFSILAIFLAPASSSAQEYKNIRTFDMSSPVSTTNITREQFQSSDTPITVSHSTSVVIRKDSFNQDVNVNIYEGIWESVPLGNSPISYYYIAFLNSSGGVLIAQKPVEIFVTNSYTGTDATLTPLIKDTGAFDVSNRLVFENQAPVRALLNSNQTGFLITINKQLDKNDASLNPTIIQDVSPSNVPVVSDAPKADFVSSNLPLISVIIVLIVLILIIASWILRRKPKI